MLLSAPYNLWNFHMRIILVLLYWTDGGCSLMILILWLALYAAQLVVSTQIIFRGEKEDQDLFKVFVLCYSSVCFEKPKRKVFFWNCKKELYQLLCIAAKTAWHGYLWRLRMSLCALIYKEGSHAASFLCVLNSHWIKRRVWVFFCVWIMYFMLKWISMTHMRLLLCRRLADVHI